MSERSLLHDTIRSVLLFALFALTSGAPAFAQSNPSDPDLAQMLRAGGHVIVFRHGATNEDQAEVDPLNIDNIAKQVLTGSRKGTLP